MIRVRSSADPVERGHGCVNHCGLSGHVEERRRGSVIARVCRVQDEGQADAGIIVCGRVCSPIVPIACSRTLTHLFSELDIVDRHIGRRGRIVHCQADTRIQAFNDMDLNIFRKKVRSCCDDRQSNTPYVI